MSDTAGATDIGMRPEGLLLAIDTASAQGGVALYDGRSVSVRSWPAERSHTTTLLAEIHHLLSAAERDVAELTAVAVAIGPGAFTGLRAGLGVAKGFHLATGVPLIGVSTLEATALAFAACGVPIVAAVGAGRGRLVWSRYEIRQGDLSQVLAPRNGTTAELVAEVQDTGPLLVCGELDASQAEQVDAVRHVSLPPAPLRIRQPGALVEVGWRRFQRGAVDDAAALEPFYAAR